MKERKKERKKEDQKKLSSFFFFEVYLGYQIPQKKRISSWGAATRIITQKKREIFLFAWPACVDASKNKAKKTNENTHTKKRNNNICTNLVGGRETPPARSIGVFTRRLVFRGDGEFARDTILEEASRYEF